MIDSRLAVPAMALALLVAGCGGGGSTSAPPTSPTSTTPTTSTPTTPTTPTTPSGGAVAWQYNGQVWQSTGTPPACPNPVEMPLPVDLSRVTSILYPGQTRGEYKPHGGFRFDMPGQTTSVTVTAPLAATVYRGARYTVGNGEIQYSFDLINSCGIMYRFGHLRDLPARMQALADTLPPPTELDSRTTTFASGQTVTAGEVIGTGVGTRDSALNVFFDYGVYDLRQRNASSQDPGWAAAHPGDVAPYAICWFDWLSAGDAARVRALPPADGQMGRTSDFCR